MLLNPFFIFKPSPVAQKILDDLEKYPVNDWDWSTAYHSYKHSNLSYQIYQNFCGVYTVCGLELGCFDSKRVDSKCKKQIKAAEKLAKSINQEKTILEILKQ